MGKVVIMKNSRFSSNPALVETSRELRMNMTAEENKLWYQFLSKYPIRVLRQRIIDQYILDFYCASAKLAIEVDGAQHYTDEGHEHDIARTEMMNLRKIEVISVKNSDVKANFEYVCQYIDQEIQKRLKS